MTRYTARDVRAASSRMVQAATDAGIGVKGWTLHPGSVSNGIAWGLYSSDDPAPYVRSFGTIGKTAREAVMTLEAMAAAFDLVARGKGK